MYSMALQDYLSQFPLYELDHDNTVRETVRAPNGTRWHFRIIYLNFRCMNLTMIIPFVKLCARRMARWSVVKDMCPWDEGDVETRSNWLALCSYEEGKLP
jgi:hypothetical protein